MRTLLFLLALVGCGTCPDQLPSDGCSDEGLMCNYNATYCECRNGKWICLGGMDLAVPLRDFSSID